jgi:hypothetical protein
MDTDIYKDDEYILSELCKIRKMWSNTETFTFDMSEILSKGLGLMYLYCNETMQSIVESHLHELTWRTSYIVLKYEKERRISMSFNGINFDYEDILEAEADAKNEKQSKQQERCNRCKTAEKKLFDFKCCKDCK